MVFRLMDVMRRMADPVCCCCQCHVLVWALVLVDRDRDYNFVLNRAGGMDGYVMSVGYQLAYAAGDDGSKTDEERKNMPKDEVMDLDEERYIRVREKDELSKDD